VLWSTKDVQEKLGLSEKSARNFLGSVPVEKVKDRFNWYDPKKVTDAAKAKAEKNHADEGSKEYYEVEKLKRQISKLDFDMEVLKGKYISKEEVFQSFLSMALEFRKHLNEQFEKLPPLLAGLTPSGMQVKIRDHNEDLITKLREHKYGDS
jgi:hypothetical protein